MREPGWAVVVPVKRLAAAKTRLRGTPVGVPHAQLVLAMAQDTVRAGLACPVVAEVLVVTDDPEVTAALAELGARVVPDAPAADLNTAVAYGAWTLAPDLPALRSPTVPLPAVRPPGPVAARSPAVPLTVGRPPVPRRWVAALAADLPALRPDELAGALRAAVRAGVPGFVPDHTGSGTTLLAAPPGSAVEPRFGPGSAARHAAAGARRLDGDWPSLRLDVDTAADLAAAARLGLGPHTAGRLRAPVR